MRARIARASGFGDELTRIGYKGDVPCGSHKLGAHFEIHIEQGPILEAEAKTIGVVTGVQGMRWYEVTVTGTEGHAGSTPMKLRRDALLGASRMVAAINEIGWDARARCGGDRRIAREPAEQPQCRAGLGVFHHRPAPSQRRGGGGDGSRDRRRHCSASPRRPAWKSRIECVWDSPAVRFDPDCIAAVRRAAEAAGYPSATSSPVPGTIRPISPGSRPRPWCSFRARKG